MRLVDEVHELKKKLKRENYLRWVTVVALALIFLGMRQQREELNSCWEELQEYRIRYASELAPNISGLPQGNFTIVSGPLFESVPDAIT